MGLKPREEWPDRDKEKMIQAMTAALADIPGVSTNFSQPIKDNVDEALAGVKGELAIKLYGPDIFVMDGIAKQIAGVLKNVRGVADLDTDTERTQAIECGSPAAFADLALDGATRHDISLFDPRRFA